MSLETAIKDFESFNKYFHPPLHTVSSRNEPISSRFFRPQMKSTWYSSIIEKMTIVSSDEEVIYRISSLFHYLMYSYMRIEFPRIESSDPKTIQISWTNEPSTSVVVKASLRQDDLVIQEIDGYCINISNQFYQSEGCGKREMSRKYSGDIPEMTSWNTVLEKQVLNVEHPWYYSSDHALSYPLLFNNKDNSRTEHRYEFRRNISKLLRVRELQENGEWKIVPLKQEHINIPITTLIPTPELWGKYAIISNGEEEEIKKECKDVYRNFWIKNYISFDSKEAKSFGGIFEPEINCDFPCLAMFWSLENRNSHFQNNYHNYTCDSEDPMNGFDPLIKTNLRYGNSERITNLSNDHFLISQVRHHFPSAPYKNGYHTYSFAWYSHSNQSDIGIVFSPEMKVKLECLIDDKNSSEEKLEIASLNNSSSSRFKLKIRLLVLKKITISKVSDKWIWEINKK